MDRFHIFGVMASFYMPDCTDDSAFLTKEESRHAIKSLRLKIGDEIDILNGRGRVFHAVIQEENEKKVNFKITSSDEYDSLKPRLHMAVSPLKFNDRFEFFVEKACEMGVHSVTPLICQRTERKMIKTDRLKRIAISALKQSGNPYLTEIRESLQLSEFLEKDKSTSKLVAHLDKSGTKRLPELNFTNEITVLIGPEGGYSDEEVGKLKKGHYTFIDLGPNILRTESAAMAVSAYFHMMSK